MTERIGDGPLDPTTGPLMLAMAQAMDDMLNPDPARKGNGFILLVFPFGDGEGRCNYVSNANRADVVVLLREQLARLQGMPEAQGRA